ILGRPHSSDCDTSCNRCLRDFQNLPYHGLLDWRLALDMARIMGSSSATVDLSTNWGIRENPWLRLLAGDNAPVPATLARLRFSSRLPFAGLFGYVYEGGRRVLIECHPLWQANHPAWLDAQAAAAGSHPGFSVEQMNPFRLLRRPANYIR